VGYAPSRRAALKQQQCKNAAKGSAVATDNGHKNAPLKPGALKISNMSSLRARKVFKIPNGLADQIFGANSQESTLDLT
jgi:hypothetical protein